MGVFPHSVLPCDNEDSCKSEQTKHCHWCCSIHQSYGEVTHKFKVTLKGRISDLAWMIFISEIQTEEADAMDIHSGRWPENNLKFRSLCKPCQIRVDKIDKFSEFRLFS